MTIKREERGAGELRPSEVRRRSGMILRRLTTYAAPELVRAFHVKCIGDGVTMSDVLARMIAAHVADDGRE